MTDRQPGHEARPGSDMFVVRLFTPAGSDVVRGHVQHVRSRQSTYFAGRLGLMKFIEEHSPAAYERHQPCSVQHERNAPEQE